MPETERSSSEPTREPTGLRAAIEGSPSIAGITGSPLRPEVRVIQPETPDSTRKPWPTRVSGIAVLDPSIRVPATPDDEADVTDTYPLTGGRP